MSINKYFIKIPNDIKVFYDSKEQLLILISGSRRKTLKLKVEIHVLSLNHLIFVTNNIVEKSVILSRDKSKVIQNLTVSLIKQLIIEMVYTVHSKLALVGVGYRASLIEIVNNQLNLQLGFSHSVYFKIPKYINIVVIKSTKLILFGDCNYSELKQISASIRDCKIPEPYKGKGILYDNENITLKRGKKI